MNRPAWNGFYILCNDKIIKLKLIKSKTMKKLTFIAAIAFITAISFTSCKRDYICHCTTTIGTVETTTNHDLPNQHPHDAEQACQNFQDNATGPGVTNCHI